MDDLTRRQSRLICNLFADAETRGMPLWLESGWAIDARLGRVTRDHGDIDIAYPAERRADYLALLSMHGFRDREDTEYGFLIYRDDVLIDTEECRWCNDEYGFPGFPQGACPDAREGTIEGSPVRCVSWQAMYFELLEYVDEIPEAEWRPQDFVSRRIIQEHVPAEARQALRQRREAGAS